ncbi:PIN domain-containing protein [Methylomagnum sp.]
MEYALVDTGVWYGMFDRRDAHFEEAQDKIEVLELFQPVLPWPTVYETLRTRFVRNRLALQRFEDYLKSPSIIYLDDAPYRDEAFELSLQSSLREGRPLSMVDCLIRQILKDENANISYLATFNAPDFADLCAIRGIDII